MSSIFALIIILLAWVFIIMPFIRLVKVSRQWQNAFKQATQQRQQPRDPRNRTQRQPTPAKKKIDPTVGEYVEFTETTTTETTTDPDAPGQTTRTTTEQQITDVTWEDLP